MAIFRPKTYPWASRFSGGSIRLKQAYNGSLGYTETHKEVSAASATAVMAATAATVGTDQTITSGLTDPDVPRALQVVPGGTTGDIQESVVTVTGTNIEGKTISEAFRFAADAASAVEGDFAFRTVTSVNIDAQLSTAATFSVGTTNKLGINHRLFRNNTTVKVYSYTAPGEPGGLPSGLALQAAPTVVANGAEVERNLVTPATAPDATTAYTIFYYFDNWALDPLNDQPEYSTTTSTSSTSSSTSTTTITTSTSSTSVSTSSTSSSTSSTSSSTSSTSTSTTTAP